MATVNLVQIYEDIYSKKVSHCALCYQTDSETRLVKSTALKNVLKALKYSDIFKNQNLCYMCEARMVSVNNIIDTVRLVLEVQRMFKWVNMSSKYRKKFMLGKIKICQNEFIKFRKKIQFHQTNISTLDCRKYPEMGPPLQPKPDTPPYPLHHSDDNLMVRKIDTGIVSVPTEKGQIKINSGTVLQRLNPLEMPYALANPCNNTVMGLDGAGNLYMIPTLTIDASAATQSAQTNYTTGATQTDLPIAHNNNKRPNEDIDGVNKTPKYSILPTIVDCRTDNNAFIGEIESIHSERDVIQHPVPEVVKHPIRTGSAVDWEDKIPMEVISFVNDEPPPGSIENRTGRRLLPKRKIYR